MAPMETFVLLRFKLVLNYLSPHGTCVAAFTSLIQPCAHTPVAVLSPAVVLRLFSAHLCNGCRVRAPAGQEGSLQHPQFLGGAGLLLAAQNHFLRLFPAAALEMVRCSRGRCTPSAWMGTCSSEATRLRATTNEPLG